MAISEVYATNGDTSVEKPVGVSEVFVTNMGGGGSGGVTSVNGQTGDVTLTASDVNALPANTSIPSKTSQLDNDSGFITSSDIPAQAQANWNETDTSAASYIQNKPSIPAAQVQSNWNEADSSSPSYIQNKPSIPTAQTLADLNTAGITDIQQVAALPASPVATVLYLIPES